MRHCDLTHERVQQIIEYLRNGTYPDPCSQSKRNFRKTAKRFVLKRFESPEILYYRAAPGVLLRVFSSSEMNEKIQSIYEVHKSNGHPGRDRLMGLLKKIVYGVNRREVMRVLQSCPICKAKNLMNTRPVIQPIRAFSVRERYIFDLIDLRHYTEFNQGYSWLLVGLDSFSKFCWTSPLKTKRAKEVIEKIRDVILIFGKPLILHTDNGKEFVNSTAIEMCNAFNIKHVRGRARCPWVQGQVERLNQTLKNMLSSTGISRGNNYNWCGILREITSAYNNMVHSTTKNTPFRLMFGPSASETIYVHYSEPEINQLLGEIDSLNNTEISPELEIEYSKWIFKVKEEDRCLAIKSSDKAAEKMARRRKWANDVEVYEVGMKVVRKVFVDSNIHTRKGLCLQ
ncbi:KRAB-A domain-containing protein 2-like [Octopus sinensis]|uniref:KRAB-A domain-containing protein 2-like n=1 Tax=Octopus sinensis TaxID=2607531 RepID=A0A6P7TQC8_9MOLL|nr:KRAB-A domain-containing protein 2-like [Octopus sinensis]